MQRSRGFTLVELLVVLAVMASVMALTPMAFDRLKEASEYRTTVRTMLSQLRTARALALAEGRDVQFSVNLQQRTYGIEGQSQETLVNSLQLKAVVAGLDANPQDKFSIRFLPNGGATGGTLDVIRASGAGSRLRVDWLSGRITQQALQQ